MPWTVSSLTTLWKHVLFQQRVSPGSVLYFLELTHIKLLILKILTFCSEHQHTELPVICLYRSSISRKRSLEFIQKLALPFMVMLTGSYIWFCGHEAHYWSAFNVSACNTNIWVKSEFYIHASLCGHGRKHLKITTLVQIQLLHTHIHIHFVAYTQPYSSDQRNWFYLIWPHYWIIHLIKVKGTYYLLMWCICTV